MIVLYTLTYKNNVLIKIMTNSDEYALATNHKKSDILLGQRYLFYDNID